MPRARSSRKPEASSIAYRSSSVLPIPGGPCSSTAPLRPSRAASRSAFRRARSSLRPTITAGVYGANDGRLTREPAPGRTRRSISRGVRPRYPSERAIHASASSTSRSRSVTDPWRLASRLPSGPEHERHVRVRRLRAARACGRARSAAASSPAGRRRARPPRRAPGGRRRRPRGCRRARRRCGAPRSRRRSRPAGPCSRSTKRTRAAPARTRSAGSRPSARLRARSASLSARQVPG